MRTVTLQTILTKLDNDAKGQRGCAFMILIFALIITMMAGTAIFSVYGLIFSMFTLLPATIFLICSRKKKKHLKNKSFYIVSDTCQRKHTKCCGEDGDAYILTFSNGVEHTISIDDAAFVSVEKNQFDDWFYDQTAVGDQFYVVYMDNAKKPTYIFPHKLCQLDTTGFVEVDGKLRPQAT